MIFRNTSALQARGPLASLLPSWIYFIPAEKAPKCISFQQQCLLRPFVFRKRPELPTECSLALSADHPGLWHCATFLFFLLLPELILLNMWKGQNRKSFYCTYWSKFHTTTEEKTKLDINAKLKTLTERVMTACIDTSFMLPQREKNFNVIELPNFWFERGTSTKLLASSSVVRNKLFLLILATYFLNLHQTNSSKMKL